MDDTERKELIARKIAAEDRQKASMSQAALTLRMDNMPPHPEPIDHNESLKAIAQAVDAINDEKLADAITKGFAVFQENSKAIGSLKDDLSALTEAVKKIPKGDMSGLVEAINSVGKEYAKNTKAITRLADVMSAPKAIVTNRNGEIVGSRIAEADDAVLN